MALGLGALAAFGHAPYGMWPITLFVLALVPWLLREVQGARAAGSIGWALGTGYFMHALVWIVEPFLVDIGRHGWMAPFALVFLAAGMALYWASAFVGAQALGRTETGRGLALIVTWSLAELARAYLLTGFPWGGIAQIWIGSPVAATLAWIGPHGLTLLSLALTIGSGLALRDRRMLALAIVPLVVMGAAALAPRAVVEPGDHTVRLVQPNAPQHQKWDPEMIPVFFQRQIDFTSAGPRPDLIVWPETSVPVLLEYAGSAFGQMAEAASGTPLVAGVQRSDGARAYNSLVHMDAAGRITAIYDKHHLVPFGEYIPGGNFAAGLGLRGFAAQEGDGYSAGPGPQVMDFGPLGLAAPLICYEAVFPQDVGATPVRGDFLLQITNDAWFGEYIGPYQHLAQARMRAIEQGLPMVRVANTGISAMIDPNGEIVAELPLGQAGYVDAVLPPPLPPTPYAKSGDWPMIAGLLAAFTGLCGLRLRVGMRNSD
jgi:apolipoprotein N-acyltransferase